MVFSFSSLLFKFWLKSVRISGYCHFDRSFPLFFMLVIITATIAVTAVTLDPSSKAFTIEL